MALIPRLFLIVAVILALSLSGCVAPIASDHRAMGVGLFTAHHMPLDEGVAYGQLQGFGLAVERGRVAIGLVDWRWVELPVPGQPRPYRTPLGVFIIGPSTSR